MPFIIESQYFPVIDWFKLSIVDKHYIIEQYENFAKMTFRNRCIISGSNGLINLTVPLIKGREQTTLMNDVLIDDSQNWRSQHWKAIVSCYSRAPFFEHYANDIHRLIFLPEQSLFNLSVQIIEYFNKALKLSINIDFTKQYHPMYNDTAFSDCRNKWLPKSYAKSTEAWEPEYIQVFADKFGFQPNLSIIDLLFCKGGF